jgi:hypothetical protein
VDCIRRSHLLVRVDAIEVTASAYYASMMLRIIKSFIGRLSGKLNLVATLTAENLALRQQLIVLKRQQKRPNFKGRDRLFWVILSRIWSGWRSTLLIVQPDTVVRWHRTAFKLYWRRKSP